MIFLKILFFPIKLILRLAALLVGAVLFCACKVLSLVIGVVGVICRIVGVISVLGAIIITIMFISAKSDPAASAENAVAAMNWWTIAVYYCAAALVYFLPDISGAILGFVFTFSEMLVHFGVHGNFSDDKDYDYGEYDGGVSPVGGYYVQNSDIPIARFSKIHSDFSNESAAFSGTYNALRASGSRSEFSDRADEISEEYNTIIDRFNAATDEIQTVSDENSVREISADAKYQLNKLRDLHDRVRRLSRRPSSIKNTEQPKPETAAPEGFNPFAGVKTAADLKKRYAKLCQAYHPDVSGTESTEQMQFINAEYKRLQKKFTV